MNEKLAHNEYDKILKHIKQLVGNKTTYLTQLDRVCTRIFGIKFRGVFPSDKIPILTNLKPYCILNLDKSTESGSHWVALAKNDNHSILYDSFGRSPTFIIPDLEFSGNGKIISDMDDSEQKITETDCGARCIAWLVFYDKYGADNALLI
jgi:hypothetical protein